MTIISLNKFLAFLITIFPIAIISGPLIPELILAFVSLSVNFQLIKDKQLNIYKSKFSFFFLCFWIYLILNALFSDNQLWSIRTSFFYFRYFIFSVSILYLLNLDVLKLKNVFISLVVTFLILILDLGIQYIFGQNLLGLTAKDNRFSGIFGDELILGSYLIKFFPLLLALSFLNINYKKKYFFLFLINPSIIFSIFLTGERTASILAILFVLISSLIIIKKFRGKIIYLITIVLLVLSIFHFNSSLKARFIDDTLNYMLDSKYKQIIDKNNIDKNLNEKIYIFSKLHHGHYTSAFKLFLEKPLFGQGVNSFRINCNKFDHEYKCSTHPHNIMLQILSEIGIIGFIYYLIVIIYFISFIFKKNELPINILSLGFIIYLFPLSPSGNFFNNWINMIFYFLIGFHLYFMQYKSSQNDFRH